MSRVNKALLLLPRAVLNCGNHCLKCECTGTLLDILKHLKEHNIDHTQQYGKGVSIYK